MKTYRWIILCILALTLALPALADSPEYDARKVAFEEAVIAYEAGQPLTPVQMQLLKYFQYSPPVDQPVIDEAGGPDDLGYMYIDSQENDGPTYDWIDISATGTNVVFDLGDDDHSGPYDIGFNFNFYENTHSQFYIQSNGTITFVDQYVTLSNYELPDDGFPALIAWFWDDLDPANGNSGANIYYEARQVGNQDALVVQYDALDEFPDGADAPNITAQVILFQDGDILIQYENLTPTMDLPGATIGIQNETGTVGLTVSHNGSVMGYPFNELALLFTRGDPDAMISGVVRSSDTNLPISGAEVVVGIGTDFTDDGGNYAIDGTYSGPAIGYEVSAAGYYSVDGTIALDPGANSHNWQLDPLPPPQDEDFISDFEDDQGFFSSPGLFDWSTISNEPAAPHSGTSAWDLVPNGDYENSMDEWLTSDTSWLIGDGPASVSYWHWFSFEQNYDGYNFKLSTDGGDTWTLLWPDQGYTDDDGVWGNDNTEPVFTNNTNRHETWELVSYDLTPYAGQQVWLAWNAVSDASATYPGVCIDDIEILVGDNGPGVDFDLIGTTTIIPPSGGNVVFDIMIDSELPITVPGLTFWTRATLPNGQQTQPLLQVPFTHTPFMNVFVTGATQYIPAFAPGGLYTYNGYLGFFPNDLDDSGFGFEKIGTAVDGDIEINPRDWPAHTSPLVASDAGETTSVELPADYSLREAFPNPFNPTTTLTVTLPESADLTVSVVNVMGQQVAQLANGTYQAGVHSLVLDGQHLSSGIYFVHATVPGQLNAVQKVTLMK